MLSSEADNGKCPKCSSEYVMFSKKQELYVCEDCDFKFTIKKSFEALRIFLSYGHDNNEELVRLIKNDLEKRGHKVWFDEHEIKGGDDWRNSITNGILKSNKVISFLSKHSTRDPGVCLDEIAIALGAKGGNIKTILVEGEKEVSTPASISHIQWLDMHDWKENQTADKNQWETWYKSKFDEIIDIVESKESRQFAGEIEKLSGYLKPISSDNRISSLLSRGFVGREWLKEEVEGWSNNNKNSRVFWLTGAPGVGKSAFAAQLSHFGRDRIIAAQFCEWDKPDHRDAGRVIRSLAFQLATRLPDYRSLLLTLPEIKDLDKKRSSELFDYLLADPLRSSIDGGRERYLILIDALDEASVDGKNPLVELLARDAGRLPDWLGLIITSRPEKSVTDPLQGLNPFILDTETENNRDDIRLYLNTMLASKLKDHLDADSLVEQILDKSEGVFLYVERVCDDIEKGFLSLDRLEEFPKGLGEIFWQFFKRQFPDQEKFKIEIRSALRSILAALEPLPLEILQHLFKWQDEELRDFTRTLGSLFPITKKDGKETIRPYHKSIIDWLDNENSAGPYYVSIREGHPLLANFGYQQYQHDLKTLHLYFIKNLPSHCFHAKLWDNVTDLLCDLNFIQAKSAAKLTYDLVKDYNDVLTVIPDNKENIRQKKEGQEGVEKYIRDLIAYAKGEIKELDIPQSQPPWSKEKINEEIKRIKTNPNRLDRLNAFINFLGNEANNLQDYAMDFPCFATQQAWNYTNTGPVGEAAETDSPEIRQSLLLRSQLTRPPWNPMPQALQTLKGHTGDVESVSITPDGKRAISGSGDKTCILWDLQTGEKLQTLKGHTEAVESVSITPDGKRAISGSYDETCILWNLQTGEKLQTFKGHTDYVTSVSITPDGKRAISGSTDKTCILWELQTGEALKTLKGHSSEVLSVSITPDGKWAVSAGSFDKTCILWDLQTGEKLQTLKGHTETVDSVSITPDGKRAISGSDDNTCILWDLQTGEKLQTLKGHTETVDSVSITPDGKRAISGSDDNTCILWDLQTGEKLQTLKGHTDEVKSVSITPDGKKAVSGSDDKTCILWDLQTGEALQALKGHTNRVDSVSITPDGKRAISGSSDKTCIQWDLQTGEKLQTLKGHTNWVISVLITPDGKRAISGSDDNTCILWDLQTGEKLQTLKGHTKMVNYSVLDTPDGVNSVSIAPDGKRAISGSDDNTCILWDLQTGAALQTLKGHTEMVDAVSISPDGKRAISGSDDKTCILWDLDSGVKLASYPSSSSILVIEFFPGGIFIGTYSGETHILNASKKLLNPGNAFVTVLKIWDFELLRYMPVTADCPLCGHRFTPTDSILNTIIEITKKTKLRPEQSPCLDLPKEVWNNPSLLSKCPKCNEKLKFNPYYCR